MLVSAMPEVRPRVLHAIVGHKLPTYFLNAVRSVRMLAPDDDLVVMDNASGLSGLTDQLRQLSAADEHVHLRERTINDLSRNTKVGGLYDACTEIVQYAVEGRYDLLHLMQGDMQMLWWNPAVVEKAMELYEQFPDCVNIATTALPQDRRLSDAVRVREGPLVELPHYGLCDTGLYHLGRWRQREIRFHDNEQAHARAYREAGLRVLCHPWPPVAPVPWPAVVRRGIVRGREVVPRHALLLRPLDAAEVTAVRQAADPIWLEDVCIPWGWTCLNPMATTAPESIEYWVFRYRDFRHRGWNGALPRWERRGIARGRSAWRVQRRPGLWQVALLPLWSELRRRL